MAEGLNINFDVNALMAKVGEAIGAVAEKFGTTGPALLQFAVRGKMAEGYVHLAWVAIALIWAVVGGIILKRVWSWAIKFEKDADYTAAGGGWVVGMVASAVYALSTLIPLGSHLGPAIMDLTAPEYMLMLDVIAMLKH